LSKSEAQLLERLASVTMRVERQSSDPDFCIVQTIVDPHYLASANPLLREANERLINSIGNVHLEILGPIGIIVESGWAYSVEGMLSNNGVEIAIANQHFRIVGYREPLPGPPFGIDRNLAPIGGGVQFSPVGREIMTLIHSTTDEGYLRELGSALPVVGLRLEHVTTRGM